MVNAGKRLTILSKAEISDLYGFPKFSNEERAIYFDLDDEEKKEVEALKSIESRVHFILQLGYFKFKLMFFHHSFQKGNEDIQYILNKYFHDFKGSLKKLSRRTCFVNYSRILTLLNYSLFEKKFKEKVIKQASELVRVCADQRYIFNGVCYFLKQHHIVIPGYSTLQKIISGVLLNEEQRLQSIVSKHLPRPANQELQKMLKSDSDKMYGITLLKKDAKSFNTKDMHQEIKKKISSTLLFQAAKKIIPKLEISEQNIRHYAYLVDYYTIDRLRELPYETVRVYLLCYSFYRFEKINDNLVNGFLYHINSYTKEAKQDSKEKVYEYKSEASKPEYGRKIGQILDFFTDDQLVDGIPFGEIRAKAFHIIEKEKFPLLKLHAANQFFDEEVFRWDYYKFIAKKISRNLRPLVRAIDFESEDPNNDLMQALTFLKETFDSKKSLKKIDKNKLPIEFIPSSLKPYLYEIEEGSSQKVLNVYQYEFLIYYQLEKSLDSGCIVVNNSFSFKSFKKDLYQEWDINKEDVLKKLNNPILNMPIQEQLDELKKDLDPLLIEVNQRIECGDNKEIKIKKGKNLDRGISTEWVLSYPKNDHDINNPFYEQFPQVGLNQVLQFVNQHCHFMEAFTHVRSRYAKTKADESSILAVIVANATNYGISQMAEISDISYNLLYSTSKSFIRLETLKNSNDILANNISNLPIFKHWNIFEKILISSLDGKKFQTRIKHIMARHSSKYFGQKRGIVSYSMIANNVCTNTKIISPNEHESHHLFDLIFNNTSDVQPDWHCGDTHSINRINFALLHLVGQRFTPHIKNISKKACLISSFENPRSHENGIIVPESKINTKLLEEEWDNVQHIFASLLMKNTTQSIIVKKLSSYKRSNKTQKALWEYDRILRSLHTLRFIDDPHFRKAIRTALNRGEGYHQLTGKIAGVNGGKFRGSTEAELFVWNECSRFIANCIIYYNALILSKIYKMQEKLGNKETLEFIKRLSPLAWRHINFNGRYEFANGFSEIDLDQMVENLIFGDTQKQKRS